MSGIALPAKGSIGNATQTVWFGAIIDRLNMLVPYSAPTGLNQTSNAPAHFGNLWNPFHASLGANTTAPDGTTNVAVLLQEDNTTNIHYIQAGLASGHNSYRAGNIPVRMAAFLKAGTRTRVGFLIADLTQIGGTSPTCTVVFDLAGGQVGVAATQGGGSGNFGAGRCIPLGTQMIAYPNGWWLCIQDVFYQDEFANGPMGMEIFLDSGSGTGSLSNNYAGDGASGAYIWRTNMMPIAAWGINSTVLFDDFNSSSTIDLNNTKAPGFNWYLDCNWPSFSGQSGVTGSSQVSVSNSVCTLTGPCPSPGGFMMQNVACTNVLASPTPTVGRSYGGGRATLYEAKMSWDYNSHSQSDQLFWAPAQQSLSLGFPLGLNGGREFDFTQSGDLNGLTNYANTDTLGYLPDISGGDGLFAGGQASLGIPLWSANYNYSFGPTFQVYYQPNGLCYQTSTGNGVNHPPPGGVWTQITYPASLNQPAVPVDYTQMHVYANLIIPYWGAGGMLQQNLGSNNRGDTPDKGMGLHLAFFDGACCNFSGWWGPNIGGSPDSGAPGAGSFLFNSDWMDLILSLSASADNFGQVLNVDYVRIMQ